jgi:hypothetical protein|tara:strand:+ start:880 stop:1089 length:210 start_codon:yes stop_codon:yes gene_type:complete
MFRVNGIDGGVQQVVNSAISHVRKNEPNLLRRVLEGPREIGESRLSDWLTLIFFFFFVLDAKNNSYSSR